MSHWAWATVEHNNVAEISDVLDRSILRVDSSQSNNDQQASDYE